MNEALGYRGPVLDLDRFNRERESYREIWSKPVVIRFGAIFEGLGGSPDEPYYGLDVVTNIQDGMTFECAFLLGEEVEEGKWREFLEGGGTCLRSNVLRMTGRVLSVEEYMERMRESEAVLIRRWGEEKVRSHNFPPRDWFAIERKALAEARKGSRILDDYIPNG